MNTTLKRSISLPLLTFYGLGTIVGAGIYVLIGKIAGLAGYGAPLAFLIAAVIATFTAFSYAELSSRYPKSAGEALYVQKAFGRPQLSIIIGWSIVSVGMISSATIANGFVGYFNIFVDAPPWLVITVLVLLLGAIAAWGISESVWLATLMTLLEVGGLIFVIAITSSGVENIAAKLPLLIPDSTTVVWNSIVLGAFLAFYAFVGFEDMVNIAEEVKNPRTTIPTAIFIALAASSVLYLLVAVLAVVSLTPQQLGSSNAPLELMLRQHSNDSAIIISAISLIAVVNGAMIQIIMGARVLYGMANQSLAPKFFAVIHPKTRTPLLATLFVTSIVLIFALALPLVTLATIASFITLLIFASMHLALWRIKLKFGNVSEAVHYPLWIPILGFLTCIMLLLYQSISVIG